VPDNLTLLCTYHHRVLHEGFRVAREADGTLTFTRADGLVIPRFGCRVEDFTDDFGEGAVTNAAVNHSREDSLHRSTERRARRHSDFRYSTRSRRSLALNPSEK
jgi:hypothetical protein